MAESTCFCMCLEGLHSIDVLNCENVLLQWLFARKMFYILCIIQENRLNIGEKILVDERGLLSLTLDMCSPVLLCWQRFVGLVALTGEGFGQFGQMAKCRQKWESSICTCFFKQNNFSIFSICCTQMMSFESTMHFCFKPPI